MLRVFYSVAAEQDLQEIVEHIARHDLSAALRWLDQTEGLFALLASQPELGERMRTRRFGEVLRHTAGNYLVYYRFSDDELQVLRVVHAAREQEPLV